MGGDAREARLAYRPRPLTASHEAAHCRPIPKARGAVQSLGVRYSSPPIGPRGSGGDEGLAPAVLPGQTIAWPATRAGASGRSGARRGAGLSGPAPRSCVSRSNLALPSYSAPRRTHRLVHSHHAATQPLSYPPSFGHDESCRRENRQASGRRLGGTCRATQSTSAIEKQPDRPSPHQMGWLRYHRGWGGATAAHRSPLSQQDLRGSGRKGALARIRRWDGLGDGHRAEGDGEMDPATTRTSRGDDLRRPHVQVSLDLTSIAEALRVA